jgi:hypothetical protein
VHLLVNVKLLYQDARFNDKDNAILAERKTILKHQWLHTSNKIADISEGNVNLQIPSPF